MLPEAKTYDVLIVGLGPAGATAAYELSRAGMSVLGLEKQMHPRYKVCGGGLSVRIDQILDSDFKAVVEHTVYLRRPGTVLHRVAPAGRLHGDAGPVRPSAGRESPQGGH